MGNKSTKEHLHSVDSPVSANNSETVIASATTAQDTSRRVVVYHATTRDRAKSILSTGFRFPSSDDAAERGLKAGAAVYFGSSRKYCLREASNTLREAGEHDAMANLVCLEVEVDLGRALSLGDYSRGQRGLTVWPIADGLLPSGRGKHKKNDGKPLSGEEWDTHTERITREYLQGYGFDTVTLNEGTEQAEVCVYDAQSILKVQLAPRV